MLSSSRNSLPIDMSRTESEDRMDRYELRCLVCDWMWTSDYSQEDCPHCGTEDVYAEENNENGIILTE